MSTGGEASAAAPWIPPWNDVLRWIDSEIAVAARRYRLEVAEREDLRQSVCVRVLESFGRFRPDPGGAAIETWVRRHATWGVADYWRDRLRRERRETPAGEGSIDPVDARAEDPIRRATQEELRLALAYCLDKLTPTQRERLLAASSDESGRPPLQELARRFGISRDTLKEALSRARVALRRCLHLRGFSPSQPTGIPPAAPESMV